MSKRHIDTLQHGITVYNDMFDHIDAVLRAFAKKKTQWKEDLFFAVKLGRLKLSKSHVEVAPMMGMLLMSAHIFDPFQKLKSFRMCDKGMDINPEEETSYTKQHEEAFQKDVENNHWAEHLTSAKCKMVWKS
jgi:hypothetical protein